MNFTRSHWREYMIVGFTVLLLIAIGYGGLVLWGRSYDGELAWECLHAPTCLDQALQQGQSRPVGPRGGGPPAPAPSTAPAPGK